MRVAILGGTGTLGEGLCLRLGLHTDHDLVVGSRDADRAAEAAADYAATLEAGTGDDGSAVEGAAAATIQGADNRAAVDGADVVVLSVPPKYARRTVEAVDDLLSAGTVLVSPAVPMTRGEGGFRHDPPRTADSLAALVSRSAPEDVPVVGAYHALPASRLADLDADLGYDVPIVADDDAARATVADLTDAVDGLRALDAGGLAVAAAVEWLTPLLLNVARSGELHDVGPRFH
ncbi:MAG: NADPH-dependent F420 reductase [Halobacteriaceae archaeon]